VREDRTLQARGRHVASRRHHRHPVLRGLAVTLASLLVVAVVAGTVVYLRLDGNITGVDMAGALGDNRPDVVATTDPTTNQPPLNILLMGSDTRQLEDADAFTGDKDEALTEHSDTNLLVHLAADRRSAFVVSIPRDSMVRRPACDDPGDDGSGRGLGIFNGAFTDGSEIGGVPGGAVCTVRTVEANTGVPVDHFAVVNFEGFRDMVDALGGVSICVTEPIEDRATRLSLPAGTSHLDGLQATQFVRARKGIGDGSDIGRIDRQQAFLSAVIREATSSKLLLRPDRLIGFLDAATATLTTDEAIASPRALGRLALQVRELPPEQIRFVTVPHAVYEPDPNRVIWTDAADAIWQAAREDLPLPGTEPVDPTTPPTTEAPVLSVTPDDVTVDVVNASGTEGLAVQSSAALTVQGFVRGALSNGEVGSVTGVVVRHAVADEASAQTVAAAFPGATLEVDPDLVGGTVRVELGAGAPAVVEVPNRLGTDPLPDQPIASQPGSGTPDSTPTVDARVASDASCT
jgi:LCP family protein required for cell wall assembly